jgi:uncharacterized membrane protein (DUF373 family)
MSYRGQGVSDLLHGSPEDPRSVCSWHSLLVVAERRHGIVKARTVLLIALLAIVGKLMIIDLSAADATEVFALATAILALGLVYWLVRDQDRREQA